ncbi:ATP synthase subunit I [Scytonema sp. UIC 10036]|uniref:ATP synthase subunit I n=1 Tax=Scytonema sp. UIC 10036 TaxID=2304196 RepID=UPI0012DA9B54|nr:ATP synthase subunit I [Scytonema sp. UIC 10036]MUG94709.1 ATP synthase subunit I [Scytonema sp. UIC 10036]
MLERSSLIELEQLQLEGFTKVNTINTDRAAKSDRIIHEDVQPTPKIDAESESVSNEITDTDSSMVEFYQLVQELLLITLGLIGISFGCVWFFYSANIALNYLIGACAGLLYLRMLVKDVERLGSEKKQLSKARFALLIGLSVLASRLEQLEILPIFLGFLTYKITIMLYVIRTSLPSFLR